MATKKNGLGKGLNAIFMENDIDSEGSITTLRVSEIEPNRDQPRNDFDESSLAELADSIARHGIIQPLLVRPIKVGGYQIVAGERRWRACRMAGVKEVPVVVRNLEDSEVMQIALIENLQREDLSPIEEAKGYKSLMDTYGFTQEEVSQSVGKARPTITNSLRLLSLPEDVIQMISKGEISAGHARALLSLQTTDEISRVVKIIVREGLSVRSVEALVKSEKGKKSFKRGKENLKRSTFFDEVELSLKEHLGRKIKVSEKKEDKGTLEIEFFSKEDLASLARSLGELLR